MNDTTFQGDGKLAFVPVVVNAKPLKQTNADRIRSMTDEELAKLMVASCAEYRTIEECRLHEKCYECWLEWLKQESKK